MKIKHTLKTLWFGVSLAACLIVTALGEVTAGNPAQARTAAYLRSVGSQPPM